MENASKALLISGGVLIAMLVLSIGVYLFANYSDVSSSYEQTMQATEIQKFNSNFLKFEGRTDITIHEIITLVNFAKQYKEQTGIHIKIMISSRDLSESDNIIEEIQDNSTDNSGSNKYFECINIKDENEDGKIDVISFINT